MSEEKKKFKKSIYPHILLLGILGTVIFLCFSMFTMERQGRNEAYHMLQLYGVRTEALLNRLFHITDVLESVVITNQGQMDHETFDSLAQALIEGKGINAIQCLPDGIVKFCYPLEGNESVIDNNIFDNPKRREDALLAVETRQVALSGPYDLTQGGFGLVARNPIFLNDGNGGEKFWGFSVVVLNLPEALDPLMLPEIQKNGYEYQISCVVNGEKVVVAQSLDPEAEQGIRMQKLFDGTQGTDYVEVEVSVPNHVWEMKVVPDHGWLDQRALMIQAFICISFTLLWTAVVFLLERQSRQMERFATTDDLTGLFNRRRLKEYMDIRCRDRKVRFAMFYIDLDRFKSINDTIGHTCGDAVLKEVGRRIKTALGKEGSVYRIGGDEFIAVMEVEISEAGCAAMARRIKAEISRTFTYDKHEIIQNASVGYVVFPEEGENLDRLLELADERMYREKK